MVNIHWVTHFGENAIGNAYGYKVHNDTLRKYTSKIAEITDSAKNCIHIVSPEFIRLIPNKINWVFTMFEGNTIPDIYIDKLKHADFLLTPSQWVKRLFDKYFDPETVFVVPHGVEKIFTYKKRVFPKDKPFRYFWVGAPNPRKGYEEIIGIWQKLELHKVPQLELYLKTTRVEGLQRRANVTIDGRKLPIKDLIKLYHEAHCFLFPTRGEGFGLTLAEAMATGLPCISPCYSGVTEFFDNEVGYEVGYSMGEATTTFIGSNYKHDTEIAYPDPNDIVRMMEMVYLDYKGALRKGKRASMRIKSDFTWEKSAQKLVDLIEKHGHL